MLCPPLTPAPVVVNWIERHRNPANLALHIVGIPPTVMALLLLPVSLASWSASIFLLSVGLFVGGYLIQFLGHALDGSEPGEWTGIRRAAGRIGSAALARPESNRGVA